MGQEPYGSFLSQVKAEWLEADRKMKLLKSFIYVDPSGRRWLAPKGSIIDGASIPQVFWTFIGSPFTGEHRAASVVHDAACEKKSAPWEDVHRMFYFACRCGGVGEIKAKIMFGAVWQFGPRWGFSAKASMPMPSMSEAHMNQDFEAMKQFISRENPNLERIQEFARDA